jgi:hypothetical protein
VGDLLRNFGAMIPLTVIVFLYALLAWPLLTARRRRVWAPRTASFTAATGTDLAAAFSSGGSFRQLGGNLLLLSPLGALLPLRAPSLRSIYRITVAALRPRHGDRRHPAQHGRRGGGRDGRPPVVAEAAAPAGAAGHPGAAPPDDLRNPRSPAPPAAPGLGNGLPVFEVLAGEQRVRGHHRADAKLAAGGERFMTGAEGSPARCPPFRATSARPRPTARRSNASTRSRTTPSPTTARRHAQRVRHATRLHGLALQARVSPRNGRRGLF